MRTLAVVIAVAAWALLCRQHAVAGGGGEAAGGEFDPASLKPFTDGGLYLGKHEMGLYAGGKNEIPAAHQAAGVKAAEAIQPLDADGKPDAADGRILAVVLGHSNCSMYFSAFQAHLKKNAEALNGRFELLNAAVGGQQLPEIRQLEGRVWDKAASMLNRPGYSAKQVQVLFFHTTYHGAGNRGRVPPRPFPQTMQRMQADLAAVLKHCLKLWPNLRVAYLTCDGFRHFTGFEPHVWQEAFGFKWLIQSQIAGEEGTSFTDAEGKPRGLPWLQWGPYIWDNAWDRTYFTDGVHPAPKSRDIFVGKYWTFLAADPVARKWLWKDGKPPASPPASVPAKP